MNSTNGYHKMFYIHTYLYVYTQKHICIMCVCVERVRESTQFSFSAGEVGSYSRISVSD